MKKCKIESHVYCSNYSLSKKYFWRVYFPYKNSCICDIIDFISWREAMHWVCREIEDRNKQERGIKYETDN